MNAFRANRLLPFAALLITATVSSCNRGYGCPTNFSLNENLIDAVLGVLQILF